MKSSNAFIIEDKLSQPNLGRHSTLWIAAALVLLICVNSSAQQPTVTVLHSFNGTDGSGPGRLIRVGPVELWGVTESGGLWGHGSIFRMTLAGAFTTVYSFLGLGDGASPLGLVLGPDGAVYGTTAEVGSGPTAIPGTFFRIAPSGALTTLFVFREIGVGYRPGQLMVTRDGAMFGQTSTGGAGGYGNIYQADTNGLLTIVHAFTPEEPTEPPGRLSGDPRDNMIVEAADGALWGTTGITRSGGTIFKMTRAGGYARFPVGGGVGGGGIHGLVPASDGTLYGGWHFEGFPAYGDYMARISPTGTITTGNQYFSHIDVTFWTQSSDGTLMASAHDKILRVAPDFSFSILGVAPSSRVALVDGQDGYLYGTSGFGGVFGFGTVFRAARTRISKGVPNDFDGDRRADVSVFRPSTSVWYVAGSESTVYPMEFFSGGSPVPGDYDGDGRSDEALFYPSFGEWRIVTSGFGFFRSLTFGGPGDIPVPADFDGDGLADVAVYRPSNGHWYNANPSFNLEWGVPGDIPVPADFDGDGKADVAVYRPSTGAWWILPSSTHVPAAYTWGVSGDVPVPADYDGDGKADIAMYRPSTGQWFILKSSTNFTTGVAYQWGNVGDTPVPADYDGDGKADVAVFQQSGYWFILKSTSNYTAWDTVRWGGPGDIPLAPAPHQNVP